MDADFWADIWFDEPDKVNAKELVLAKHPKAYAARIGNARYEIRVPGNRVGIVGYWIISDLFSSADKAWDDAANKLG